MSVSFLPSFQGVRSRMKLVTVNGVTRINASYDEFIDVLKLLLRGAPFDEKWYLAKYPDVADAVAAGIFTSGRHHFIDVGYFEGRRPGEFEVDEKWYIATYPDVEEGIKKGKIKSPHQHFNDHGYEEGRRPSQL